MGGETIRVDTITSAHQYPQLVAAPKGKQITNIYRDRLKQFTDGGQYREQSLTHKIVEDSVDDREHVKLSVWSAPDLSRPTFAEATRKENEYRETHIGESFGPSWSTHWFKVKLKIPYDWIYKPRIELHWDSDNEGLIWSEDGAPIQGLTGNGERVEWILPDELRDHGRWHTIYIEMACNGMFGCAPPGSSIDPPDPNKSYSVREAALTVINLDARALFYDFWIVGDAAREFPDDSWQQHKALQVCNAIMDKFIAENGSKDAIVECRKIAKEYLGSEVDSAEVYDGSNDPDTLVTGIGHCHIDTCWLWPFAETKRKVARSWSNQCDLLDRYPEYRFCASQAQQYKWLEQLYPHAWDRVKEHVKKGNFQPIGGSWVEHDTNMPSGESLVRQFLYGQRFFESRFGTRCKTFWLPDTFGYSAQLPQICRLAGMNRFFTQKLSWNNINKFPHTTFNWVALDGSQVICHMAPSETYTAEAHFGDVKRSMTQHKSLDQDASSLLVFGKGDGGGGPTFEHLEKLRRCRAISDKVGLLPRVRLGDSVEDFFDRLEQKEASGATQLVTWYGELYFELHRGTYTTQANNKRNNRKAEILIHDLEYFATLATIWGRDGYKYPKKDIDMMWENILRCQFHDCLPGSSIRMAYDESDSFYAEVFSTGGQRLDEALHALGFDKAIDSTVSGTSHSNYLLRTSAVKSARSNVSILSAAGNRTEFSHSVSGQRACSGLVKLHRSPDVALSAASPMVHQTAADRFVLENANLRVQIEEGVIVSIFDKAAFRDVVPKGKKANQFVVFDDKPLYWQAWDVEVYHLESRKELRSDKTSWISEQTSSRVSVSTQITVSDKSSIVTTVSLGISQDYGSGLSMIEIGAEVDWHETMKFLKVEFPTSITNTEASYETQFGLIRRPTHYNTSWDMAKFEVCCHKWADLSENGYGVSILNDSKYGFATCGNLMRLSLLRSPKAPDADADMGKHRIRWAIYPHVGALDHRTVDAAVAFNQLEHVRSHKNIESVSAILSAFNFTADSSPSLRIDTIKRGEDDEDVSSGEMPAKKGRHVILRVYDPLGGLARGVIQFNGVGVDRAWKCNVLEDELEELKLTLAENSEVQQLFIELRAFEVATYKLRLKQ